MRTCRWAICLIFLSVSTMFSAGTNEPVSVAVFDLEARAGVSTEVAAYLTETLRSALFDTGAFTLVERTQMERVIAEQKLSLSGLTGGSYAVELGKLVSAKKIVVGSAGKVEDRFYVSVRSIDAESGKVDNSATLEASSTEDLARSVKGIAQRLAGVDKNDIFAHLMLPTGSYLSFDVPENLGIIADSSVKSFADTMLGGMSNLTVLITNAIAQQDAKGHTDAARPDNPPSVRTDETAVTDKRLPESAPADSGMGITFGPYAQYCIVPVAFGAVKVPALKAGLDFVWHVNPFFGLGLGGLSLLSLDGSGISPALYGGFVVNFHCTALHVVTFELDNLAALGGSSGNVPMPALMLSSTFSVLFRAAGFLDVGLSGGVVYGPELTGKQNGIFAPTAGLTLRFAFGE